MRKILWMIVLLGVYIWLVTSGNDRIVLETGKSIYQSVVNWFDDAEIDYQLNRPVINAALVDGIKFFSITLISNVASVKILPI